ncbi:hypothetical protein BZA05DRAFT_447021 [Tricharina praecox]|uniref:uncharacterized protein n=1 Tax=Tricharina praecox TaxID=43433 RepID=UPI0022203D69|nr:uncharacterized protein BZA05DRAFT_447021 [Tricharina praecox]KAI5847536.1 hypothetical protein BZA05DRAFT_447021 [Tricharina praecox]
MLWNHFPLDLDLDLGTDLNFDLDFGQQELDGFHHDNTFFGFDFPLFDRVNNDTVDQLLEKSIFDDPALSSIITPTPTTPDISLDSYLNLPPTTATAADDFLEATLSSTITIPPHTTTRQQKTPSPDASQGSEESTPTATTPSRNVLTPPPAFADQLTPPRSTATSTSTFRLPTPPSTLPTLPLFPPLGHSLPTSTLSPESSTSSRKRRASFTPLSPRPKELVETDIHSSDDDKDKRRKRNTAAARRYRQKKQDRMKELEDELNEVRKREEIWKAEALKQRMEAEKWFEMWTLCKGK